MNGKILQKCVDELKKGDKAEIKYVLGMLEALLEMEPNKPISENIVLTRTPGRPTSTPMLPGSPEAKKEMDEGAILDAEARANLSKIDQSAMSTEQPQ